MGYCRDSTECKRSLTERHVLVVEMNGGGVSENYPFNKLFLFSTILRISQTNHITTDIIYNTTFLFV